jgi:hypothetical protein
MECASCPNPEPYQLTWFGEWNVFTVPTSSLTSKRLYENLDYCDPTKANKGSHDGITSPRIRWPVKRSTLLMDAVVPSNYYY